MIHHESPVFRVLVVAPPGVEVGEVHHQSEIAVARVNAELGAELAAYEIQILPEREVLDLGHLLADARQRFLDPGDRFGGDVGLPAKDDDVPKDGRSFRLAERLPVEASCIHHTEGPPRGSARHRGRAEGRFARCTLPWGKEGIGRDGGDRRDGGEPRPSPPEDVLGFIDAQGATTRPFPMTSSRGTVRMHEAMILLRRFGAEARTHRQLPLLLDEEATQGSRAGMCGPGLAVPDLSSGIHHAAARPRVAQHPSVSQRQGREVRLFRSQALPRRTDEHRYRWPAVSLA